MARLICRLSEWIAQTTSWRRVFLAMASQGAPTGVSAFVNDVVLNCR